MIRALWGSTDEEQKDFVSSCSTQEGSAKKSRN